MGVGDVFTGCMDWRGGGRSTSEVPMNLATAACVMSPGDDKQGIIFNAASMGADVTMRGFSAYGTSESTLHRFVFDFYIFVGINRVGRGRGGVGGGVG